MPLRSFPNGHPLLAMQPAFNSDLFPKWRININITMQSIPTFKSPEVIKNSNTLKVGYFKTSKVSFKVQNF